MSSLIDRSFQLTHDERVNAHHHTGGQIALDCEWSGSWQLLCVPKDP
jgi:hypothetical protein